MAIEWVNSPAMFRNDGSVLILTSTSLWAGLFTAVTANTGGGGGGSGGVTSSTGGAGGSGVVVVRWLS